MSGGYRVFELVEAITGFQRICREFAHYNGE